MDFNFSTQAPQKDPDFYPDPSPEIQGDPVERFQAAMAEFDLYPDEIKTDGKINRFDTDKRGDKAGWYSFHLGDICAGAFGSWKTSIKQKWCSKEISKLSWQEREQYHQKQADIVKARKAQEAINHAHAKKVAKELWVAGAPVDPGGHPYLVKKGLADSHNLRVGKDEWGRDNTLLVPTLDEKGEIWSLQYIDKDGKKLFQPLGKRTGLFFEIPGAHGNHDLFIAEGVATGATIREKHGATIYCAFQANQMPAVAKAVRSLHPGKNIIIAADNDQWTKGNPGIEYGREAAREIDAPLAYPKFTDEHIEAWRKKTGDPEKGPTDFNDMAELDPAAVMIQLGGASKKDMFPPLTAANTSLLSWLPTRPQNRDFIMNLFNAPLMPKGVVGVLAATGGTGKTFFLMALAYAAASGKSFGPISVPRPLNTLAIFGEDDKDEVGRRFWDISGGDPFPETLHATSVYGEVGPLMRVENGHPERAAGFYWLEETLKAHPGIDLLIIDPKSRFYGLDENNNDHATEWIRCLEYLCKRYVPNILFAAHTSQDKAGSVSQAMNRGASAIVDGCRWQAGLAQIDPDTADKYRIENPREYVTFDTPKSNYSARQNSPIYFKRTNTGTLEHVKLELPEQEDQINCFLTFLKNDSYEYTRRDLKQDTAGKQIFDDMKKIFPGFKRRDGFNQLILTCIADGSLKEVERGTGTARKTVLVVVEKQ